MKKIYFIPGVGANELIFSELGEFPYEKVLVKWIKNQKNESIESYVSRLIEKYGITKDDIISGVSFGGILAQEISRQLGNEKVILISSFRDKDDFRLHVKIALDLGLNKFIPKNMPKLEEVAAVIFNSATEKSKPLVKQMIQSVDYDLMYWSIQKIAELPKKKFINVKAINLIGTSDRLVKTWISRRTHVINDGSHLMIYDKADEITSVLNSIFVNRELLISA